MNRGYWILFGAVLTFTSAWAGLVYLPYTQLGDRDPFRPDEPDSVSRGRRVYQANGCIYCHSQQVRPAGFGVDLKRGWGERRSLPEDYVGQWPVMLGTMRTGPDLSNVGRRYGDDWQHRHLYNPRMMTPGSIMPSFRFLYRETIDAEDGALELQGDWARADAKFIVPTEDAVALVAYLASLKQTRIEGSQYGQ